MAFTAADLNGALTKVRQLSTGIPRDWKAVAIAILQLNEVTAQQTIKILDLEEQVKVLKAENKKLAANPKKK